MKTQLLITLLLFFILSCNNKNDITPTALPQDFRNQYIGDYYCKAEHIISGGGYSDTTVTKIIHVYKFEYKITDSAFIISGSDLLMDTSGVVLNPDMSLSAIPHSGMIGFRGYFVADSIYFSQFVGSAGASELWDIKGKKQ